MDSWLPTKNYTTAIIWDKSVGGKEFGEGVGKAPQKEKMDELYGM